MAERNEKLCRICLKPARSISYSVFAQKIGETSFVEAMNALFEMKVDESVFLKKNFPQMICHSCEKTIKSAWELRKLAWISHNQLANLEEGEILPNAIADQIETDEVEELGSILVNEKLHFEEPIQQENDNELNRDTLQFEETGSQLTVNENIQHLSNFKPSTSSFDAKLPKNLIGTTKEPNQLKPGNHTAEIADISKIFCCDVCSKKFGLKDNLLRHLRTHFNIQNYSCSFCAKTFVQSSNLHVHIRIHTGEKPFLCSICSKTFAHSASLKRHMETHFDKNNSECLQCGMKFKTTNAIRSHILRHHGRVAVKNSILKLE